MVSACFPLAIAFFALALVLITGNYLLNNYDVCGYIKKAGSSIFHSPEKIKSRIVSHFSEEEDNSSNEEDELFIEIEDNPLYQSFHGTTENPLYESYKAQENHSHRPSS